MVIKNVIRTYWGMQKSKVQNHIMCPLRGLVQHRPKNPPNLGRMGCLCQLLSPKGHMIWFLFFQYTFPVAKWVRKYPPCALHKTFLVRCLRKYSDQPMDSQIFHYWDQTLPFARAKPLFAAKSILVFISKNRLNV